MSFYDDASLVVIPSAQKTSKLYAVKPTDGSGDLAFTRTGDTATRVGPDGLIQEVRTNLVLQSQTFDNASWTKDKITVTANVTTAPNGTTTADKVVDTLQGNSAYRIYNSATLSAISYSASFYVKAAEYSWVYIRIGNSLRVWFNVTTGVVGGADSGIAGRIENAGNGWYRCTAIITTATAGGGFALLGLTNANNVESYTPTTGGQGVFVWGAQLETNDFGATAYIPTTTAAVSVGPVANVPRLDYLGSTCPRLLLEPQRTNLVTYSEQINNAAWVKNNSPTITTNIATAPDGTISADGIQSADAVTFKTITQTVSVSANGTLTLSFFVKKETSETFFGGFTMYFQGGTNKIVYGIVNAVTGTVTYASSTLTATTKVEDYGTYWRIASTTTDNGSNTSCGIGYYGTLSTNGTALNTGAGSVRTIWGFQAEAGAYATSYIPTLAASATRGAENCSKSSITSLIGQTEGTIYAEIVRTQSTANDSFWINISDNTANNWIFLGSEGTYGRFYVRASNTVAIDQAYALSVGTHKLALAYKSGSIVGYLDGVQIFTSAATFTLGSLTGYNVGASSQTIATAVNTAGAVNQTLLFKTRLRNAELAELTTL